MKLNRRGFALISTFVFIALLFMMAVSMILTSRQRIFSGMSQHHQAEALYLAEAALGKAQVALETDLSWPGVTDATIDEMNGTYTVTFGTGKYDSVNNIAKYVPADSYRGEKTVPNNSALLVVVANVRGHRYVLESLVEGNGAVGGIEDAILASGRIESKGDLEVDGIEALDDSDPVDGNMQSNLDNTPNSVKWDGTGSAVITGTVGTKGSTMASIDMPGANIMGGPELNTLAPIPNYDITSEVDSNLTHTAPTFVVGGTTTIGAGKYTVAGGTVQGDIKLEDNATLYVNGDLTVNGSIEGNGTVWVKGKTTFKGDSSVTTNPDFSVSLYSKGNVKLTGFDGTEFLDNMNPTARALLDDAEFAVEYLQHGVKTEGNVFNTNTKDYVNDVGIALGENTNHTPANIILYDIDPGGPNEFIGRTIDKNTLARLQAEVVALPPGQTRDFLDDRVGKLQTLFSSADDVTTSAAASIGNFDGSGDTRGFLDAVVSGTFTDPTAFTSYMPQAVNLINQVNYDKLGSSYFQGAIYTNGHFYADNEVSVLGALIVDGNGSAAEETITLPSGGTVKLKSGDIYLGNRTRVTFVKDMFDDVDSGPLGPQNLRKKIWMGR